MIFYVPNKYVESLALRYSPWLAALERLTLESSCLSVLEIQRFQGISACSSDLKLFRLGKKERVLKSYLQSEVHSALQVDMDEKTG